MKPRLQPRCHQKLHSRSTGRDRHVLPPPEPARRYLGIYRRVTVLSVEEGGVESTDQIGVPWREESCSEVHISNFPNVELSNASKADLDNLCGDCVSGTTGAVTSIILSAITAVPTMMTDLQRATPYGDANCQKMMGLITGVLSLLSGVNSLRTFRNNCMQEIPSELTLTSGLAIKTDWYAGPGLWLLGIATFLKSVDVICHLLVPTPPPKRKPGSDTDSLADYMERETLPTRWGAPAGPPATVQT